MTADAHLGTIVHNGGVASPVEQRVDGRIDNQGGEILLLGQGQLERLAGGDAVDGGHLDVLVCLMVAGGGGVGWGG